ncbi:hypothetical protein HK405_003903 [Cladochytrium tenue]|nr:hypothetical protein HK405_003903 [Cladochytrium tenue]
MSTSIQDFLTALAQTYSLRSFVLGLALGGATPAATGFATSNTKPDCSHSYALGVAAAKAASDGDGDTQACVETYNACVSALLDFRKAHTKLVSLYIITQALKGAKRAGVEMESDSGPARGSGGTGNLGSTTIHLYLNIPLSYPFLSYSTLSTQNTRKSRNLYDAKN